MSGEGRSDRWWEAGLGLAVAGVGLMALSWQTHVTSVQHAEPFWGWVSYLGVAFILFGIGMMLYAIGADRWLVESVGGRWRPWHRTPSEPAPMAPEPPRQGGWMLLHPLVVDGQLRFTLRHSESSSRRSMYLNGCEATVEGPDGTFTNVRASKIWAHLNGVYKVDFPRDFDAKRLRPGRYVLSWTGRATSSWGDGPPPPIKVAERTVVVTDDWQVLSA